MSAKGGFKFININVDVFDDSGEHPTLKIDGIYEELESNRGKPIYLNVGNLGGSYGCVTTACRDFDSSVFVLKIPLIISPETNLIYYMIFTINSDDVVTSYTKTIALTD